MHTEMCRIEESNKNEVSFKQYPPAAAEGGGGGRWLDGVVRCSALDSTLESIERKNKGNGNEKTRQRNKRLLNRDFILSFAF